MLTREIVCLYCGRNGKIEVPGRDEGPDPSPLFRFLGHNPFSGHMHYRCPACGIVLLVEPTSMLAFRGTLKGNPDRAAGPVDGPSALDNLSRRVARFVDHLAPSGRSH